MPTSHCSAVRLHIHSPRSPKLVLRIRLPLGLRPNYLITSSMKFPSDRTVLMFRAHVVRFYMVSGNGASCTLLIVSFNTKYLWCGRLHVVQPISIDRNCVVHLGWKMARTFFILELFMLEHTYFGCAQHACAQFTSSSAAIHSYHYHNWPLGRSG